MKTWRIDILSLGLLSASLPAHAVYNGTRVSPSEMIAQTTAAYIDDDAPLHSDPTVTVPSYCTVTILSQDIAVTAAHCIKDFYSRPRLAFGVDARHSTYIRKVTAYEIPKEYVPGYAADPIPKNNHDIALVLFEGGLPEGFYPAQILPDSHNLSKSETIWIAGYGYTTPPLSDPVHMWAPWDDGVLREAEQKIGDSNYASQELQVSERDEQYGTKGDSGGPAFVVQGDESYVVGVCNWGNRMPRFEIYADIRVHRNWVAAASAVLEKGNGSKYCQNPSGCF